MAKPVQIWNIMHSGLKWKYMLKSIFFENKFLCPAGSFGTDLYKKFKKCWFQPSRQTLRLHTFFRILAQWYDATLFGTCRSIIFGRNIPLPKRKTRNRPNRVNAALILYIEKPLVMFYFDCILIFNVAIFLRCLFLNFNKKVSTNSFS